MLDENEIQQDLVSVVTFCPAAPELQSTWKHGYHALWGLFQVNLDAASANAKVKQTLQQTKQDSDPEREGDISAMHFG